MLFLCLMIIIFFLGLYFYIKNFIGEGSMRSTNIIKEGFETDSNKLRCPNLLIQYGSSFYLFNTELKEVPGVNPIVFNNLEEYKEFLDWQRSVGIRCPVLYLQQSFDTQNNRVYKVRPSVTELKGGLPPIQYQKKSLLIDASRDDYPYNTNSLPGIDTKNQDIGKITPLDVENDSNMYSLNNTDSAMSDNWNPKLAQQHIEEGVYKDNEVKIMLP